MTKKLTVSLALMGLVCSQGAYAQDSGHYIDAVAHSSGLFYGEDSIRDDGYVYGLYSAYRHEQNMFELGVDQTHIEYSNGTDLDQTDATVAYSRYDNLWNARVAAHYISSDDVETDDGIVGLVSFGTYPKYGSELGASVAYSSYDNIKAVQLTPYASYTIGNKYKTSGAWVFDLQGYAIDVTNDTAGVVDPETNLSAETNVTWYRDTFFITAGLWAGEQTYAVKKGGFVVYNLGEVHKGGAKFGTGFNVGPTTSLKMSANYDIVDESRSVDTTGHGSIGFTLGHTF